MIRFALGIIILIQFFCRIIYAELPEAALSPISALGNISEIQKGFIFNRLEARLSKHFKITPQSRFKQAQDQAFQELDLEQCTEEQCIRKIQETLQVESLFVLQILRENNYTQLTLSLIELESKKTADRLCEQCDVKELIEKVEELVDELLGALPQSKVAEVRKGNIEIISSPINASIFVDGKPYLIKNNPAKTPAKIKLTYGEHSITLKYTNYADKSQMIEIKKQENGILRMTLDSLKGHVVIGSNPSGARIQINDMVQKNKYGGILETPANLELPYGTYDLTLKHSSSEVLSTTLKVDKPLQEPPTYQLKTIRSGVLEIVTEPPGASILLDGKSQVEFDGNLQKTPSKIRLSFGTHQITLQHAQYREETISITMKKPSYRLTKALKLPWGLLTVNVTNDLRTASVFVNEVMLGNMGGTISKTFKVEPNIAHSVYLRIRGYNTKKININIAPNQKFPVRFKEYIQPIVRTLNRDEEPQKSSNITNHAISLSIIALSGLSSLNYAQQYNTLAEENKDINAEYKTTTSKGERDSLFSKFKSNQKKMKTHRSNARSFDIISLLGIIAETYFVLADNKVASNGLSLNQSTRIIPQIAHNRNTNELSPNLLLQWRF